jgi:hypothetical protein
LYLKNLLFTIITLSMVAFAAEPAMDVTPTIQAVLTPSPSSSTIGGSLQMSGNTIIVLGQTGPLQPNNVYVYVAGRVAGPT